ncbi:MAG: hypothetical protein HY365_03015 [Candidatus Aenigmarchaeota archaeon]|nr:hypothetical protein [Candidatus Aenigmarchaeota archaeon]
MEIRHVGYVGVPYTDLQNYVGSHAFFAYVNNVIHTSPWGILEKAPEGDKEPYVLVTYGKGWQCSLPICPEFTVFVEQ